MILDIVNSLMRYWVESHWAIALGMSVFVNAAVYLMTSEILERFIRFAVEDKCVASYVDDRVLREDQKRREIFFGLSSCTIFAIGSLFSRELFDSLWPQSIIELLVQIVVFAAFYETYSYFVHRLLHLRPLRAYHGVHHSSVRCTVWSAYSVHPVEAAFIGVSAPIFMVLFPMSLGVALVLHIFGMMFTIFLHSNVIVKVGFQPINYILSYPEYHSMHHKKGAVNYGFVNRFWDSVFKTN